MAAVRLQCIQEEYTESIRIQLNGFLLWSEEANRGWNDYVAAHWEKSQASEDRITLTRRAGAVYPGAIRPAHFAGRAAGRQHLFGPFHLEVMRASISLSQRFEDLAMLHNVAEGVGCNVADFATDIADPSLRELVWREFMTVVEREGMAAIPTMFRDKRVVEDALAL